MRHFRRPPFKKKVETWLPLQAFPDLPSTPPLLEALWKGELERGAEEGELGEEASLWLYVVYIFVLLLIGLWGTYLFHNFTQPSWHCLYSRGYLGLDGGGGSSTLGLGPMAPSRLGKRALP